MPEQFAQFSSATFRKYRIGVLTMEIIIGFTVIGTVMFALIKGKERKPEVENQGERLKDGVKALKGIWNEPKK